HELLVPMVQATDGVRAETTRITADAGYHREANLRALASQGIDALIADGDFRRLDARFVTHVAHHATNDPLHDKSADPEAPRLFQPADFQYDAAARTCVCLAGKALYRTGQSNVTRGFVGEHFQGAKRECLPCVLRRSACAIPSARPHERTPGRVLPRSRSRRAAHALRADEARIDTPTGRARYAQRFVTVEPVFGNLRHNKRLARFTLRSQAKVTAQWTRVCLVHLVEKLAHYGVPA
ncbi:MAG: transposase, partial [Gemmatimonadota bacterium]